MTLEVSAFYDRQTATVSYLVADAASRRAAVIDSVLDFNPHSGRTGTASADRIAASVEERGLTVDWLLETHPHADHLSAAPYLQRRLGGRIAIGAAILEVQEVWREIYDLGDDLACDGSQFDRLFADEETFQIGGLLARVWHTPGHTPACVTYLIGAAAFVGDTLFMPDFGTARADFPGGDARRLYRSIRRILSLPPETRLFTCHDYCPGGREPAWETTVAAQRAGNKHVRDGIDEAAFVALRCDRDRDLDAPDLLLPAIQVNIRGGRLPAPGANGTVYLKLPLNRF